MLLITCDHTFLFLGSIVGIMLLKKHGGKSHYACGLSNNNKKKKGIKTFCEGFRTFDSRSVAFSMFPMQHLY